MCYWLDNQNQMFRHEFAVAYLLSPKRNAKGARVLFSESMREVSPGDLIIFFLDALILAIGIAESHFWESPKPTEFGEAGLCWKSVGCKVRVGFTTPGYLSRWGAL